MNGFWVFAYGSLIWQPGFAFEASAKARLNGYRRSLCLYSHVFRGTPEKPGLVLGLTKGDSCSGLAYYVPAASAAETLETLRKRELVASGYHEVRLPVALLDGSQLVVEALCYVIDESSPKYSGSLTRSDILKYVRQGVGQGGTNIDYVRATLRHLQDTGIHDEELEWFCSELQNSA